MTVVFTMGNLDHAIVVLKVLKVLKVVINAARKIGKYKRPRCSNQGGQPHKEGSNRGLMVGAVALSSLPIALKLNE